MGLTRNVYRDSDIPFFQFGGTSMSGEQPNFINEECWISIYAGESGFSHLTSLPDGNYPPVTWRLPLTAGALSSRNKISGNGTLSASANIGYQISASLSGSGTVTSAIGQLIVNLIASISGQGTINSANISGFIEAIATLTGSGAISDAKLTGIGDMIADIDGMGDILASIGGVGALVAEIKSYGDLSAEGLRDAIWNAVASNYTSTGTMGAKLNVAASGGVDYDTLAEAVWDKDVSGSTGNKAAKVLEDIKKKSNLIPGLM